MKKYGFERPVGALFLIAINGVGYTVNYRSIPIRRNSGLYFPWFRIRRSKCSYMGTGGHRIFG